MDNGEELARVLVEYLFHAPVPTAILGLAKTTGLLPIPWKWVALPMASALFFLGSFLMAGALIRAARRAAGG